MEKEDGQGGGLVDVSCMGGSDWLVRKFWFATGLRIRMREFAR